MIRTSGRLILSLLAGLFMAVSVAAPAQAEITEGDRSELNDMIGNNKQLKNLMFELEQIIFKEMQAQLYS